MQVRAEPRKIKADKSLIRELPPIPDKLYFTIGEAANLCAVKTHVLRFWEQEFSQLRPNKRRGNRRYYQRDDIILLRNIRDLLYFQGFTIDGAKARLLAQGKQVATASSHQDLISELLLKLQDLLEVLELDLVENSNGPT